MARTAQSKSPPWVSFGNRLYKRGHSFYIRVIVPRDLRQTIGKGEVCEPLKASDRREAERLCRQRSAAIDRDFAQHRGEREGRKGTLTSRDLDAIAQRFFRTELAEESELIHDDVMNDPAMAVEAIYQRFEPWAESLEEDTWSPRQNEFVREVLTAAGADLGLDHPLWPQARNKIVRALLGVGRGLDAKASATEYRPSDPLLTAPLPPPVASNGITLGDLLQRYETDKARGWSTKTRDGYALVFRVLQEAIGESALARSISRDDCRRLRQILMDLTPNYTRHSALQGMTMEEAAKISREMNLPLRKPVSVNACLTNLAAIMSYAETEELIDKNPAKGLKLPITVRRKDRRSPFSIDQLQRIFGPRSPIYGAEGVERNARYWVPLIALWTGMRLNEICQLHTTDIRYQKAVPIIVIEEGEEVDGKRVKTEAGERFVPVHPELERIGFLDHWRAAERARDTRLFPELTQGAAGYFSNPFSQWFLRYLKLPAVNAYTRQTQFHSFRHSYRDALREAGLSGELVRALGGWSSGGGVSDDYGAGFSPERLYEAIKAVGYPGLDLGHLENRAALP